MPMVRPKLATPRLYIDCSSHYDKHIYDGQQSFMIDGGSKVKPLWNSTELIEKNSYSYVMTFSSQ